MKNNFKVIIFYVVLIGVILIATAGIFNSVQPEKKTKTKA